MRKKLAIMTMILYTLIGCTLIDTFVTAVDEPARQENREQRREKKRRR